jgi:outer membrane lipoprotein-sorting protein
MKLIVKVSLTWFFLAISSQAIAESPEDKGYRIAKESDSKLSGWKDYTADGQMTLKDASGKSSIRSLSTKLLEGAGDKGDKSMMVFHTPKDIKGTSLLTWSHVAKTGDQWLYLPALKRVKRIASSNKSGPFMGSEFSYEDLTPRNLEKYTYKFLKTEACGKLKCHVIEAFPTDKKSAYTRQVVFIDIKELRIQKIKFFDRKKSHLKTMRITKYKKYNGKHWAASKVIMKNHLTKKSTLFQWSNYKYENGLKARSFDKNSMKRAR